MLTYAKILSITTVLTLLLGCQNPYKNTFVESKNPGIQHFERHKGKIKISRSYDFLKDYEQLLKEGYVMMGMSDFNSPKVNWNSNKLKSFARKIGAEIVLWRHDYTNTMSAVSAITYDTPQTQTSTYSGNIKNKFDIGSNYKYSGTITTQKQQRHTSYIPYLIHRYSYGAMFLGKLKEKDTLESPQGIPSLSSD